MTTEGTGAASRPPFAPEPRRLEPGRVDRWAQRSANVPFRLKVAIVWLGILAVLSFLFWASAFDSQWIREHAWFIARGLAWTLLMAAGGIVLAILLALLGALGRLSRNPIAYGVSGFYTSFFRGTPLIVQLFLFYLALPRVGINIVARFPSVPEGLVDVLTRPAFQVGVLVLGLNYGAYMTEIFRAGIQSVSHGQAEAADALGMTYRQKMRRVVLPQAFRVIIPPTGNEFIAMMKDTALVSVLGQSIESGMELFARARLTGNADVKPLEALISAAAAYWALTAVFTYFQSRLERRVSKGYVRAVATGPRARDRRKLVVTGAGRGGEASLGYAPEEVGAAGHAHAGGIAPVEAVEDESP